MDNFQLEMSKESGSGEIGSPALWVEKCSCPKAYVGDFCEECAPGFRHSPANGGPFTRCIPCECNGHSQLCDTATGKSLFKYLQGFHSVPSKVGFCKKILLWDVIWQST